MTSERGSFGRRALAPMSTLPAGASRAASGATPRPAVTAAATAAMPPPTKASTHAIFAPSSARTASACTPQGGASVASRNGAPARKPGAANQPKRSCRSFSPSRRDGLAPHQHGVERAVVECVEQRAREADAHIEPQRRVVAVDARDQRREFRPRRMFADAEGEAARRAGRRGPPAHAPRSDRARDRGTPRRRPTAAPAAACARSVGARAAVPASSASG